MTGRNRFRIGFSVSLIVSGLIRPAGSADPPPVQLLLEANRAIEASADARGRGDDPAARDAFAAARAAATTLAQSHQYPLAAERIETVESWSVDQVATAIDAWDRLTGLEAESVLADPDAIGSVLTTCREMGDRWCEARALLARAESLNEASLPQQVRDDTAAAEAIFRTAGPSERLGRTLVLRRGSGAGEGDAAIEMARQRFAEAILIAQQVGVPSLEGRALCERVRLEIDQKQMEAATADIVRMQEIAASGDTPRVAACAGYREGYQLYLQGNPAGAADRWRQVAESDAVDTAPREAVWSLVGVTALSINTDDGAAALRWARKSVQVADRLHGSDDQGRAYCNFTTALVIQGRFEEAEAAADRCLSISRANNLKNGEEIALRGLGHAARNRGETERALAFFRESLEITREIRNPVDGIWNLLGIGRTLESDGDLSGARDHFQQAVETADWLKWPDFQAQTRAALARVLVNIGKIDQAEKRVEEAMNYPSADGSIPVRPWALKVRGLIHTRRQNFTAALADFRIAYDHFETMDKAGAQAALAIDIGNVYYRLYRPNRALEYYERGLALANRAGNTEERLIALGNIALLKRRALSYESAIELHRDVIREAKKTGKTALLINQTIQLADAFTALERYEEAERHARDALALSNRSGGPNRGIHAHRSLANVLSLTGQHREAVALCRDNLRRAATADPNVLMDVRWTCGWIRLRAGQPDQAVDDFRAVIRIGEESRRRLGPTEIGASLFADRVMIYSDLVHALVEAAGPDLSPAQVGEIFDISESFRARVLLAALVPETGLAEMERSDRNTTDLVGPDRSDLLGRMADLHLRFAGGEVGRDRFMEQIRRLEDQLAETGRSGNSGQLLGSEPIDLETAQSLIPDDRTAVLEYLLGGHASYAVVLTRHLATVVRLEGTRTEHDRTLHRYRSLLESRGNWPDRDMEAIASLGGRIFDDLVAPALEAIGPGFDRLVVVGDGPLYLLPFEALVLPVANDRTDPRFLVEDFEVALIPSISVLAQLSSHQTGSRAPRSLTALANPALPVSVAAEDNAGDDLREAFFPTHLPALPYSEEEIRNAARRLGGEKRSRIGREATEANARDALQAGFPIVHFATHGFLDPHSYGRSGLVLTPEPDRGDDGLLQAREVIDLRADTDLVILSGCSTGVGRIAGGEGALGLPHSLFQAGVPSVVQSLWAVRDRAAALFMERFYAGLSDGMTLGEAMRTAKLDLLRSEHPELSHPSVWAPFVLSGLFDRRLDLPEPTILDRVSGRGNMVLVVPLVFFLIFGLTGWAIRGRFRSE